MINKLSFWLLMLSLLLLPACTKSCTKNKENKEPSVFFEQPKEGQVLTSPFEVKFGVNGMKVRPALEDMDDKNSGHHHLMVDHPKGFVDEGLPVPADARHIHYGKGETSTTLQLPPGVHTISMQFADGAHRSYGQKMAATINITVVEK